MSKVPNPYATKYIPHGRPTTPPQGVHEHYFRVSVSPDNGEFVFSEISEGVYPGCHSCSFRPLTPDPISSKYVLVGEYKEIIRRGARNKPFVLHYKYYKLKLDDSMPSDVWLDRPPPSQIHQPKIEGNTAGAAVSDDSSKDGGRGIKRSSSEAFDEHIDQ